MISFIEFSDCVMPKRKQTFPSIILSNSANFSRKQQATSYRVQSLLVFSSRMLRNIIALAAKTWNHYRTFQLGSGTGDVEVTCLQVWVLSLIFAQGASGSREAVAHVYDLEGTLTCKGLLLGSIKILQPPTDVDESSLRILSESLINFVHKVLASPELPHNGPNLVKVLEAIYSIVVSETHQDLESHISQTEFISLIMYCHDPARFLEIISNFLGSEILPFRQKRLGNGFWVLSKWGIAIQLAEKEISLLFYTAVAGRLHSAEMKTYLIDLKLWEKFIFLHARTERRWESLRRENLYSIEYTRHQEQKFDYDKNRYQNMVGYKEQ
ncbi:hypothetical protein N431DRAFT_454888 [Stipitochalara longipes BDJ]|nr:hypothetical protein N431DRAFT_454888 [Stipitochalara longipes BDJ]